MRRSAAPFAAWNVTVSGTPTAGETLTVTYDFYGPGFTEGATTFRWLRSGVPIASATASTYVPDGDDVGHTIQAEVTAVAAATGWLGQPMVSSPTRVIAAGAPTALNVAIAGTPTVGETLTGSYTYSDPDGSPEGTSTFRWLRDGVAIGGATATTYELVEADIGAVITFEVTPVSTVAPTTGTPVVSAGTDPVDAGIDPLAESHYLQFDGVGDYAYANAVFGGISADYTIAIKVATKNTTGTTYIATGGPGASVQYRHDRVIRNGSETIFTGYVPDTGDVNYNYSPFGTIPADSAARIFAIRRTAAGGAGGAKVRLIKAAGVESTSDRTATMYEPDHISIGAQIDDALAVVAATYGNVAFVSALLASAEIPDAELSAWLADDTAVGNVASIDHYWNAAAISGSSIPAQVGTVPLTLVGPVVGDLVAL